MTAEPSLFPVRWTSWLRWLGLTLAGLLAGFVVFLVVGITVGEILDELFPEFVFGLVLGTIFGTAFGLTHWLFLRRYVSGIKAWIPATIIAFALAATIIFGLLNPAGGEASLPLRLLHAAAVGLSLGLAQWRVVRDRLTGPTYLWIAFSIAAWSIGELAGIALESAQAEPPLALMTTFLVGAALSGLGMVWLLRQEGQRQSSVVAGAA